MTDSSKLVVDFSSTPDQDLMDAGVYDAIITDFEVKDSKSSEYPYINWTLTLSGGQYDNRKQFAMSSLSPKAAGMLKGHLQAFGETKESLASKFTVDPAKYIGCRVRIKVIHEVYQDVTRDKVDRILPHPEGPGKAVAGAGKSAVSARSANRL